MRLVENEIEEMGQKKAEPGTSAFSEGGVETEKWGGAYGNSELSLYRDRTVAFLRKYFRLSVELGRLPSVLGREFFRTQVTSYTVRTFEDVVIFVHDIEQCLEAVSKETREIVARVIFQCYSQGETADLMGYSRRQMQRRMANALDEISEAMIRKGILIPVRLAADTFEAEEEVLPPKKPAGSVKTIQAMAEEKSCQEQKIVIFGVSG